MTGGSLMAFLVPVNETIDSQFSITGKYSIPEYGINMSTQIKETHALVSSSVLHEPLGL